MSSANEKQVGGAHYTYFHTRNDTGAVFYVGKGKGARAHSHDNRNIHWGRVVAKHGYTVHFAMVDVAEVDALEHEKFLILCFKNMGIKLVNMTDGGDGVSGYKHSEESIASMTGKKRSSTCKMSAWQLGRKSSIETRLKMSNSQTGRKHTEESKQKMSESFSGKPKSEAHIASLRTANLGKPSPMLGKKHSESSKVKMKNSALTRKPMSDETKLNMGDASKLSWEKRKGLKNGNN